MSLKHINPSSLSTPMPRVAACRGENDTYDLSIEPCSLCATRAKRLGCSTFARLPFGYFVRSDL
jgi:hypothetical protein